MRFKEGKDWLWMPCSCTAYASTLGINIPLIDASSFKPNGTPQVGGLVLMKYKTVNHVAFITEINGNDMVIRESNYTPCKLGTRTIPYTDKAIIGYWNP